MKKGGGMCIIDRREEAHREKGDMYLEKGMEGEGSFQVDTSESNLKLAGAQNRFKTLFGLP